MTLRNLSDQGFDDFRKQRKRMQARTGEKSATVLYDNSALRELEQVEEREVREQQLTREVHDFFAAATRQAAAIVDRVAKDVQLETGARVEQEMEAFLFESLARMNTFVLNVLHQKRGPIAETQMEPKVGNLVGQPLDEFRWAGTADVGDKHIGQDPFAVPVDEVQREFRAAMGAVAADSGSVPIDQHLVATVDDEAGNGTAAALPAVAPMERTTAAPAPAPASSKAASVAPSAPVAAGKAVAAPANPPAPASAPAGAADADLERFKNALKALVRQGVMNRDEALAAWQARLAAMGVSN
ncbi:MAG: hypothetical protein JNK15_05770 [Planctomycetes bacterium]|nr:hypothetical protein [Planctomycetota bacterium]